MDIEDDLREISENEFEEKKPENKKIKRLLLVAASIFLVILIVTYIVPGNIFYILEGRIVSEKLTDFSVNLKNSGKVVFEKSAYEKLRWLYFSEQRNEFKACLLGKKEGKDYFVSDLYLPKTFGQGVSHVSAELCNKETIISLHTHPYKRCIFSEQDIKSYEAVRQVNPDAIIGLMCEADRFGFYGF